MASIQRFDPFNELVDDFFKGFLVRPLAFEGRTDGAAFLPRAKVDIAEKNGAYLVTAELPGVRKDDIHVSIDGAQVTLDAEVKRVAPQVRMCRTVGAHIICSASRVQDWEHVVITALVAQW